MRWYNIILVLFVAVIAIATAEPEPKKYKPEVKTKEKEVNLTDEEKKFLREVEEKFGIKTGVPLENESKGDAAIKGDDKKYSNPSSDDQAKVAFPGVIAIEIVNDTDDKDTPTKGKRTIDANLGYGYQTNNGYTYTYVGKQSQDKPKFMIYPYSQQDIPASNTNAHSSGYNSGSQSGVSSVHITPSQAYELVQTKEEETGYNYEKPSVQLNTKYENIHSVEQPPPLYPTSESAHHQATPQTFYTTYNGQQFSGLSGRFPSVMSNYLVDSSQLLRSPQYQSAGLTNAHFHSHGSHQEQKVVPVLVLRVPSSYLKKPTAELYADAPHSVSQYLNVNLQELVNQYFKKLGYSYGPQVTAYQNSVSHTSEAQTPAPVTHYEHNKYASPYVQPAYTHADHAGVQYSAVQPVMARYPAGYTRQQYYAGRGHQYQQPQQQYTYRYRYVPQTSAQAQSYYTQPQYQQAYQQAALYAAQQAYSQQQQSTDQETSHEAAHGHGNDAAAYSAQQPETNQEEDVTSVQYETVSSAAPNAQEYEQQALQYEAPAATPQYETQTESAVEYGPTKVPLPTHQVSHSEQVHYEQPQSVEVYPRGQTGHNHPETDSSQTYQYQTQVNGQVGHDDSLPLSENYPSKDHTIATVLPQSYNSRHQNSGVVQSVSYVTPEPTMKYHAKYRVMVPQTVISRPTEGQVSYVNSQSPADIYAHLRSSRYHSGRDARYATAGKLRASGYPWSYHTHMKRMLRPESKSDTAKTVLASEKSSS